jgi:hypothetical protein
MQAKVPQNVQMADKIVGPLTLRHMIIIGAGGGLAYLIYTILARQYFWEVWLPPVAIVVLITVLIAFVKIYNVTFGKFIILFFEHHMIPRQRIWNKSSAEVFGIGPIQSRKSLKKPKDKEKSKRATETMKNLDNITKVLDSYGK